MYYERIIDKYLFEWSRRDEHKPLLLRGARQVGKSTAVQHLGEQFEDYVEVNFEKQPAFRSVFEKDLNVKRIVPVMSAMCRHNITPGKTLLFLDEIQDCPKAVMALRFFKEDMPDLHVIAAGSLLEFTLEDLPAFGVGRIHSMYMYPMTFDEFLLANGEKLLLEARNACASASHGNTVAEPLPAELYDRLVELIRIFILVGGMPESVAKWVNTHDFLKCQEVQDDILMGYEDDFPKYHRKVDSVLLRNTMRSVAIQASRKFIYAQVPGQYTSAEVRKALDLLEKAGIIIPVVHTNANGLPLGDEADPGIRKMLLLDTGLMLRLLNMTMGDIAELTAQILTASAADLVNKGTIAEMLAGLEYLHYQTPNIRHEMFYWVRQAKNSLAEVDYILPMKGEIMPMEVKAGVQGGMKSLWEFMREKNLTRAIRCSLENFGSFAYTDTKDMSGKLREPPVRHIAICPLYALSQISKLHSSTA